MNLFTKFWLYIGQHSGQLQTIIGVIAVIIGVIAVLYARKQREDSLKLAKFNLQLKLLETAYDCEKEIETFKQQYQLEILEKLNNAHNQNLVNLDIKVPGDEGFTFREAFNLPFELLKSSETATNEVIKKLTLEQDSELSRKELELALKQLIEISSIIRKSTTGITTNISSLEEKLQNISKSSY